MYGLSEPGDYLALSNDLLLPNIPPLPIFPNTSKHYTVKVNILANC